MVKFNGVFRIFQNLAVGFYFIGNRSINKPFLIEKRLQFAGVVFFNNLEKLLQVNNLMVAPVADVRPRVIGLNGFPVKAVFSHPVGIVAIEGGSVQKLENHAGNKFGVRMRQRLPVLENIPPVSFVIQNFGAIGFVLNVDGKIVPGAAGVAVPAAEF